MTKTEQRAYIKGLLRTIGAEALKTQSESAARRLIDLPEFKRAKTVLTYQAMKRECDPALATSCAYRMGKCVAFPLCAEGDTLILCVPNKDDPQAFHTGAYGIIEPDPARCEIISYQELDFVIVPGLGFDKNLNRLGRGKGYYDRLLCATQAYLAGFAFDEQVFTEIATESHDRRVNCVVTCSAVYR